MAIVNPFIGIEEWTEEEKKRRQALDTGLIGQPVEAVQPFEGAVWKEGFPTDVTLKVSDEDVIDPNRIPPTEEEKMDKWKELVSVPWEEFQTDFPGIDISTYEEFGGQYPFGNIPVYDPFGQPYPELDLERYKAFEQPFPKMGELYGEAEDLIGKLLRGEQAGIPVEEIMEAYSAEERAALEEILPEIRESWAERGLLRSGMARESERKEVLASARRRATKRADLMKEDVLLQRQSTVTGLGLAMQITGMGFDAQKDAYSAANNEYTKVYQSSIQAGMAEGEASERAWNAANQEYARQFASQIDSAKFSQEIKERAYEASRDEYTKVYRSQLEIGQTEFQAQALAWEAAQKEFARIQQMEFQRWMTKMEQKFQKAMTDAGVSANNTSSIWGSIGTIVGSIFAGPIGGAIGSWVGGLFD